MTLIAYVDSAVLVELHTREQRTREYVATLRQTTPDDNMTDGQGELRLPVDPLEVNTEYSGPALGPPSNVTEDV